MSGLLGKIFSSGAKELVDSVGNIVDGVVTSDDEKSILKEKLTNTVLSKLNEIKSIQSETIKTEMNGNWLQRSWRPILMLSFAVLLFMKWLGYTESVDIAVELELMGIIKIGLGGYVIGRSVEKIASNVTENIDLPFIKKKNR